MTECVSCGKPVSGEGTLCAQCLEAIREPTTSFTPVNTNADEMTPKPQERAPEHPSCLLVVKGPHVSERFYLENEHMRIGRDPRSDLFLNDQTVSREHAVITRTGDVSVIKDSDSLNGTYVNGKIADAAELKEGDEIQIGTFHLLFTSDPEGFEHA